MFDVTRLGLVDFLTVWESIAVGIVETGPRDTVLVWPGRRVRIAIRFTVNRGYSAAAADFNGFGVAIFTQL